VVLTIASSGSTPALPASIQQKRTSYLAGLMLSGLLFGGAMGFRKRLRGGLLSLFLVIAATFAIAGLSGCGSGVNDTLSPIGANTITIQGQSTISTSPLVTVTHTQTITVNITSGQ